MDFFTVGIREGKKGEPPEVYPSFVIGRSKDLMVRGKHFYAVWDEEAGLWSKDEYKVQELVDAELRRFADQARAEGMEYKVKYLRNADNGGWYAFRKFMQNISDNSTELDNELTFANTEVKKSDFVSRRLPYPLAPGDHSAWDELTSFLYSPEEKAKIEWAIGAIVAGDAKKIQKFVVFYGPGGTGKSTIMNIIEKLFVGYSTVFEAKALVSNNSAFATEAFRDNPLVAIQQDGDLSKMEDNSKFNSIISHEPISMNEKYKPTYRGSVNAFLFMGTNQPVKIADAKSGIIRRLIDVHPTGNKLPPNHYHALMARIDFELGAIAQHCLETYRGMGKNYYNAYQPLEMMFQTDIFFNFIEANYDIFEAQNGATLKQAYTLYKAYCNDTGIDRVLPQYKVREELRNYFEEFKERHTLDDNTQVRSYYLGFNADKFKTPAKEHDAASPFTLVMDHETSLFDLEYAEMPAQGFRVDPLGNEVPAYRWANVKTTLADVNTTELHYVKVPEQHIVIDFDLKDDDGNKSLEKNLEAASLWPSTYAELSKGGNGVHLHYNYDGDVTELAQNYDEGIEVKTLLGDASLRRRLSKCNNVPVAAMGPGRLPVKEKKKMLENRTIQSEKGLRDLIGRSLQKEFGGTKVSVDFIKKILEDVYESGMAYDVSDLKPRIIAFANNASNQPLQALKIVKEMKFKSDADIQAVEPTKGETPAVGKTIVEERLAFFDVEVYPNLFVVCWKFEDAPDSSIVKMINPSPQDIEPMFKLKLVGFHNRRYDNHILYARYLGYDNEQLYNLSQKIIAGSVGSMFGEAYSLSYTDILDYSSKKQSLKKFEIELGLKHMEMDIPWDKPVPEEMVQKVVDYCANDVSATEAVHKARKADFTAREILAELSGLTVNDTTQKHTAKIIFGNDRNPQASFVYTELATEFPGYKFDPFADGTKDNPKSTYMGEDPSEGGYVYAEPGAYENVAVLDVASMHPTSIINLNLFGEYTPKFADLLYARLAIKHGDYDEARKMLDGRLAPYLKDESSAEDLSYALKIVINIVYGLTSAKFDNPFRDRRNVDNIVAKRGALFMIELKNFVQSEGFQVVHVKTDSIKIPNATNEIVQSVMEFGKQYGYSFEHEATYDKFCLVNDAVYIARYGWAEKAKKIGTWDAVGAQFQHPYVYKTLFTKEPIEFDDMCETKQVQKGSIYIDFDAVQKSMAASRGQAGMQFIGRIGRFLPVTAECGGGILYRVAEVDGQLKNYAVSGTKGYFWLDAELARSKPDTEIDYSYFEQLIDSAYKTVEKFAVANPAFGDFDSFVN